VLAGTSAMALAQQVMTSTSKPGYYRLRSALMAVRPAIDPRKPVLTDPITNVLGRAAGWDMPEPPPLTLELQQLAVMLHHPAIDGDALMALLPQTGSATIVINEQVVGAGAARKFDHVPGLTTATRSGPGAPHLSEQQRELDEALQDIYGGQYPALNDVPHIGSLLLAMLRRPVVVFAQPDVPANGYRVPESAFGSLIRHGKSVPETKVEPFLNSAVVTLASPSGCADALDVVLRRRASFESAVMIWLLDPVAGTAPGLPQYQIVPALYDTSRVSFSFTQPMCAAAPMTLLVHSDYWWDFRFDIVSAEWRPAGTAPSSGVQRALTVASVVPSTIGSTRQGQPVTWTAWADGGTKPYRYRFFVFDGARWTAERDWDESSTFTWTPPAGGMYQAQAWVVGADSTASHDAFGTSPPLRVVATSPLSVTALIPSPPPPLGVDEPVTWTASATGGTRPYAFQFSTFDGAQWEVARDWSTETTWTWAPPAGQHQVRVRVRSAVGDDDVQLESGPVIVSAARIKVQTFGYSPDGPLRVGTRTSWTAAAVGGTGPYTYQFWLFDGTTWTLERGWGADPTWSWTPKAAGVYSVQVWVRGAGSTALQDAWAGRTGIVVSP
jgi:hypothetical protein